MATIKQFKYVHSTGTAAKCLGFKIPSADDGGLVVNQFIPKLGPMVEAGILTCEAVDGESEDATPTEVDETSGKVVVIDEGSEVVDNDTATTTTDAPTEDTDTDGKELPVVTADSDDNPKMYKRDYIEGLNFDELKKLSAIHGITGRGVGSIISKLDSAGLIA